MAGHAAPAAEGEGYADIPSSSSSGQFTASCVCCAATYIYIYIYIYISADESSLLKLTAGQAHTSALLKAIKSGEKAHWLHDGGRLVGGVCGVRVGFSSQNIVERGTLYASGWRHA